MQKQPTLCSDINLNIQKPVDVKLLILKQNHFLQVMCRIGSLR